MLAVSRQFSQQPVLRMSGEQLTKSSFLFKYIPESMVELGFSHLNRILLTRAMSTSSAAALHLLLHTIMMPSPNQGCRGCSRIGKYILASWRFGFLIHEKKRRITALSTLLHGVCIHT